MATEGHASSGDDLANLSVAVGGALPPAYADFLRTAGGGDARDNLIVIQTPDGVVGTSLMSFYGECVDGPPGPKVSQSSRAMVEQGFMPRTALLVCHTSTGSYIVLSAEPGPTFGVVYFTDQPFTNLASTATIADFDYFYWPIASSFEDLFNHRLLNETDYNRRLEELADAPLPERPPKPSIEESTSPHHGLVGATGAQIYRFATGTKTEHPDLDAGGIRDRIFNSPEPPQPASWEAPFVEWSDSDDRDDYDLLLFRAILCLRERAYDELRDLFEDFGDLFEVDTRTGPLWVFRCTNHHEWDSKLHPDKLQFDTARMAQVEVFKNGPKRQTLHLTRAAVDRISTTGLRVPPLSLFWSAAE